MMPRLLIASGLALGLSLPPLLLPVPCIAQSTYSPGKAAASPQAIRSLVRDLVDAATRDPAKPYALRKVLAEHNKELDELLSASDPGALLARAGLKSEDLSSLPLGTDELIHAISASRARILAARTVNGIAGAAAYLVGVRDYGPPLWVTYLGEPELRALASRIRKVVFDLDVRQSQAFRELLKFDDPKIDVSTLLARYVNGMPAARKRRIVLNYLSLAPDASLDEQALAVIKPCGPILKKILQLAGRQSKSETVRQISRLLLARAPGTSTRESINRVIETELGRPARELYGEFDFAPARQGTIASGHPSTSPSGKSLWTKVVDPAAEADMDWEIPLLRKISEDMPALRELFASQEESFRNETDLAREAQALRDAEVYNTPEKGIRVPALSDEVPSSRRVLNMERVPGTPISELDLDQLRPMQLLRLGSRLTQLARKLVAVSLFHPSGLTHTDPSMGNLHFHEIPGSSATELIVTDWGSTARLTRDQQRAFLQLTLSAASGSSVNTLEVLGHFNKLNLEQRLKLRHEIEAIHSDPAAPPSRKLEEILTLALHNGVKIPSPILSWFKPRMQLREMIALVNAALDRKDPGKKLPRFNLDLAIQKELVRQTALELKSSVWPGARQADALLTPAMVWKYGATRPDVAANHAWSLLRCMVPWLNSPQPGP